MGQDLIFLALAKEAPKHFDRKVVTDILSKGAIAPVSSYLVEYPDGSFGESHSISDDPRQTLLPYLGFVHFGGRMIMERIYELADTLAVVLAWSDSPGLFVCVTRAERLERAREIFNDVPIAVARDASHLNQLVKGSTFEENGWSLRTVE